MKLLKKLTKVVSAVLASVAVFSVGFSASALDDKCMVFKVYERQYNIEPGIDSDMKICNSEGRTEYVVHWDPRHEQYCLITIPNGECLCSIDRPYAGDNATCYMVWDDANGGVYYPSRASMIAKKWRITSDRVLEYVELLPNPDFDTKGYIKNSDDENVAIVHSKGLPRNIVNVITFLATVAFLK